MLCVMHHIRTHKKRYIALVAALLIALAGTGLYFYLNANAAVQSVTKSGTVVDLLQAEPLSGESTGVVNILLTGNSVDDPGHDGAALTDSIMVASYNIGTRTLSIISIPRDLYVTVNGAYMKINAAHQSGDMQTLIEVVQSVTGLKIHHNVLVNYSAVTQMIDAVGGIDITIAADDPRGIYDPMIGFSIANGVQHLDGEAALLLARCRNDPTYDGRVAYGLSGGDFDRTASQRAIMQALLVKISSSSSLANPALLQSLIQSLSGNVASDFTAGQLRRLYDLNGQLATSSSLSLSGDGTSTLLADYYDAYAGAALIPAAGINNYASIQAYIAAKIGASTSTGDAAASAAEV